MGKVLYYIQLRGKALLSVVIHQIVQLEKSTDTYRKYINKVSYE